MSNPFGNMIQPQGRQAPAYYATGGSVPPAAAFPADPFSSFGSAPAYNSGVFTQGPSMGTGSGVREDEVKALRALLDKANNTISTLQEDLRQARIEIDVLKRSRKSMAIMSPTTGDQRLSVKKLSVGKIALNDGFDELFGNPNPASVVSPTAQILRRASTLNQKGVFSNAEKNAAKEAIIRGDSRFKELLASIDESGNANPQIIAQLKDQLARNPSDGIMPARKPSNSFSGDPFSGRKSSGDPFNRKSSTAGAFMSSQSDDWWNTPLASKKSDPKPAAVSKDDDDTESEDEKEKERKAKKKAAKKKKAEAEEEDKVAPAKEVLKQDKTLKTYIQWPPVDGLCESGIIEALKRDERCQIIKDTLAEDLLWRSTGVTKLFSKNYTEAFFTLRDVYVKVYTNKGSWLDNATPIQTLKIHPWMEVGAQKVDMSNGQRIHTVKVLMNEQGDLEEILNQCATSVDFENFPRNFCKAPNSYRLETVTALKIGTTNQASLELWVRALRQCITHKRAILDENLDSRIAKLRKKEEGLGAGKGR